MSHYWELEPGRQWAVSYTTDTPNPTEEPRIDWRVELERERQAKRRGRLLALEIECAIRESGV